MHHRNTDIWRSQRLCRLLRHLSDCHPVIQGGQPDPPAASGRHFRRLLDLVHRAGGTEKSTVGVFSVEESWAFNQSTIAGPQLRTALLATHLNGERLNLDHGYPLRLIAANRAGVLNTKWLGRIVVS